MKLTAEEKKQFVTLAREILRGILRHEFRHHLEYLAGIHGSDSLEAEDERKKQEYLAGISG